MNLKYEQLCKVHVQHKYFDDRRFTGFNIFPTEHSKSLLSKYGLIFKLQPDGFFILFANPFGGSSRGRLSLLRETIALQFSLAITDLSFYGYTGNLPPNLYKRILWFSNFDEKNQLWRKSNLLHKSEFVSESDIKPSTDVLNSFGYIEIQFDVHLKEDLYIRFLNKSTYWRYILIGEHLQKFEKLAILDKANQILFSGPEIIDLPGGKKGIAFISAESIALTQQNNKYFQLVVNYNAISKHFERELISRLPGPQLSMDAKFNDGNNIISEIFIS